MVVAKDELEAMLEHPDVANRPIPILIFANKSDKQEALPSVEIMSLLELQNIKNHAWHIQYVARHVRRVSSTSAPRAHHVQDEQCFIW